KFGWLRHLSAKEDALSASYARSSITDWIENGTAANKDVAWREAIAAHRLISWLCHSDMILNNADHDFYIQFKRCLATHVRFLKRNAPSISDSYTRMLAYAALSYASVCHDNQQKVLAFARERLARELETQILPDGGHISRNPSVIVDILSWLLPLRQACTVIGIETPDAISRAIERMLPALRFYRLGDGNLVRFNGSSQPANNLLVTLLRYDEALGEPVFNANHSGYQRLVCNDSIAIMDVGNPPKGELSVKAHAGCLSFEFSSGHNSIVVNCGSPANSHGETISYWRSTAAHSTASLCETSSCRFENSGADGMLLRGQILSTGLKAETHREDTKDGTLVMGAHSGYVREFGARVERILTLDEEGDRLRGQDQFTAPDKGQLRYSTRDAVAIRFHLHPDVKVARKPDNENACIIKTRDGENWQFSCAEFIPAIEESIFFATSFSARRRSFQIVLHFNASNSSQVNWVFQKMS
ncbi:MAG: heparinase II/III family protein, partial [Pseudomonadota bacterium]